ncbi:MerR family transcriptional regulator [Actinomadura rudentiformis]|uniref:Helix-turn-helix domain-containing protein n=1 Tax=Actinomadura rudentiformis TaxID=359158 RepID=A0A6H9YW17_9ACTN|nr:hypothetical protein [Actinomadura rudentiformis]KAB2344916.1 hypothetical protein F8566_30470 [Actinomadura rudentiformis]
MNDLSEPTWTRDRIAALGPVTDVPTAASILDISPDLAYSLIRKNEWATRVLHLGRAIKIPTKDLLDLLYPVTDQPTPVAS